MKTKLIIAVLLCLSTVAFIYKENAGKIQTVFVQDNAVGKNIEKPVSPEEQQKYLDYLLSAKYSLLEFEKDYSDIGTGQIAEDNSEFGNGIKVIHCSAGIDKPGYIGGAVIPGEYGNQAAAYSNDSNHTFYIKPRLRIRKELIMPRIENYNSENLQTNICRLEIINSEGRKISEVEYIAKNFLEVSPEDEGRMYYSGDYLEGAGGFLSFDSLITVSGKDLNPKNKKGKGRSKIDYRIYWYGYTDVWLDKIEIKNDVARELTNGRYDAMLNSMKNITKDRLEEIRAQGYPEICYVYIYKKIFKDQYSLK